MIDEAQLLCDRIERLVDDALSVREDEASKAKVQQLREIRSTISNLDRRGIDAPAELRDLEARLADGVGEQEVAANALGAVQDRLGRILGKITSHLRGFPRRSTDDAIAQAAMFVPTFGLDSSIELPGLTLSRLSREVLAGGRRLDLTPKEFELLWFFSASPGVVYTREQLLQHVWQHQDFDGDGRTVDQHVKRLRRKLESASAPCRISTIWGVGYRFDVLIDSQTSPTK
jgi:DNA-binding winged helix-turn-helix (wHTH) protein